MYKFSVFFEREGGILSTFILFFLFYEDFEFYKQSLTLIRFYTISVLIFTANHVWLIYNIRPRQISELLLFGTLATKTGYIILREQRRNPEYKEPLFILSSGATILLGILLIVFAVSKMVSRYL